MKVIDLVKRHMPTVGNGDRFIRVWPWDAAPEVLRPLSRHGGDEDWVALVPPSISHESLGWMESGTSFSLADSHWTDIGDGWTVVIASHS